MKIRQGFVSNSSSSSFTLFVKKDAYDAATALMDGPGLEAVRHCSTDHTMGNDRFVCVHEHSDMGGEGILTWACDEHEYDDDESEAFYEGIYALETLLKKQFSGTFLRHST